MHTGPQRQQSQDKTRKQGNAKHFKAKLDRAYAHYLRRYAKQVKRAAREAAQC
jgi:hypothetical protein